MSINIKTATGLQKVGGNTATKLDEHISDKIAHITSEERTVWNNKSDFSGAYDDLKNKPNLSDNESGDLVVADKNGNAIMRVDSNGVTTTNVNAKAVELNGEDLATKLDAISLENITDNESGDLTIADPSGNTIVKINESGLETTTVTAKSAVIGGVNIATKLDEHTSNTDIHVTSAEKTTWNNKSDFSGDYGDLKNAPDIVDDGSGEVVYVDTNNNVILRIGEAGLETTQVSADNIIAGGLDVKTTIVSHTGNNDIHITAAERTTWNAKATTTYVDTKVSDKATQSALTTHTGNTTVHITSSERTKWNNKSDFSGAYLDLEGAPNITTDDEDKVVYIADQSGNVIVMADANGLRATDILVGDINGSTSISANDTLESFNEHVDDTVAHITASERTKWNNKSDFSGSYNDLTNKPTLGSLAAKSTVAKTDLASAVQTSLDKADTALQSVPAEYVTETELTAKGYLTAVPSEYITETELTAKKYLTAVPSEYITETELAAKKYLTSYTETDPTVPSWAKASSKPSYTASEVGAVPTTRKVNNKALSADITLTASDVGAMPSTTTIPTVVDNLTSTSTTNALSAKQGKLLNDAINSITTDLGNLGGGDMLTATYDKDKDGIVDNAAKLEGHAASYFATADHTHSNYLTAHQDISHLALKTEVPSVVNNLTSTSTTSALSAAQGKALNEKISNLHNGVLPTVQISSSDGMAFTATINGVTTLTNGMSFIVTPTRGLACATPTLNINSLGAYYIKRPLSTNNEVYDSVQMYTGMSYLITYYNSCWILTSQPRIAADDIDGTIPVSKGGTGVTTLEALRDELGISESSGGTYGMVREFNSGLINTNQFYYDGIESKFYIVTLNWDTEDGVILTTTLTIDYRSLGYLSGDNTLRRAISVSCPNYDTKGILDVGKNYNNYPITGIADGSPVFEVKSGEFTIGHVCGYI